MKRIAVMVLLAGAVMCGVAQGVEAEIDMGRVKDARAELEAGKYSECLHELARLLAHTSALEKTRERGMLLAMRGECLLQVKQGPAAEEAFEGAASSYPEKDRKDAGRASATAELIKKSVDFKYTPTTGDDKTAVGIVDLKTRPAAFAALFRDELAEDQKTIEPLLHGTSGLQLIEDFAPKLQALDNLETAGTGSDTQTAAMAKGLAEAAKKSLDAWIAASSKEADTISTEAAKMVMVGKISRLRGITAEERISLETIMTTGEKVPGAIKMLEEALSTEADYFKKEGEDSKTVVGKVRQILKTAKVK